MKCQAGEIPVWPFPWRLMKAGNMIDRKDKKTFFTLFVNETDFLYEAHSKCCVRQLGC